ncbi:DNA starvation/stationary phase protection protein [Microbacterium sp. zg.Y1090]|uniref:Dps family protein n=1 Tax=Microbacterium TaxID=33882 RepID=UPI00214ADFA8|nr:MULTISPECIES: DNA starvation/stationary phase protection protein [unclassified Microbacterium]MCR2811695.1 DNA starvation/stationary phase protection protein [Microbacterium sp. zg.Y1084]MCR2818867.1 DNA starvation/stationary phase protection protein [Microbacterium sp. zg.Y1090]MDL5486958.1 DNA starvation/stationary phase protection protein [Microbacterium sp. zg-Y1211]WIM27180.1 DNA starvation/stationary phase protection protein [Microbacterium sp. zg-Y1090]
MTKHQTIPATAADPTVAAGTAQFLTPVVVGLQALVVNGKQAHWNVRGANFQSIHELLDTVVEHAQAWSDEAAERIVALGLPIDARLTTVAEKAKPTAVPAGFAQWDAVVRNVLTDIDAVLVDLQSAIDGLDEVDLTSQDVAIGIKAGLEKDRWFLFAHLAE